MEYIVEKEQKVKKLSDDNKLSIAKKIVEDFDTFNRARERQLEIAKKVSDEIYFRNVAKVEKDKTKQWKSIAKMCKIFMFAQILKAFIWKNTYANTKSMFDCAGATLESDNDSNKQKTMLVNCMEGMEFSKTLDKIIDYSLPYGEVISFSTWKKKTEEYRRPISFFDAMQNMQNLPKMIAAKQRGDKFYTDEKVVYNNPYTYDVDPANFVFDAAQSDDFDSCPKIHRTWKTPDYIINNKYFEVSKDVAEHLKAMVKGGSTESDLSNQDSSDLREQCVNGSTVEMLEHWGDLTLEDGTVLKNWYAVVVAGKYLVQFEKNPIVINPFTFGAYITDPKTKRGISPLYAIYDLAMTQEDMLRRTMDLQKLSENKPTFAGKGFFGDDPGDIEVYPGKIIEYDPQLYASLPIKQMEFETTVFQQDLAYLDDLMSEISGIFPNMAGASENDRTTATEISTKVEGQLTRLKMLLDVINQNLILSCVKVIAKLKANFTFGQETIYVDDDEVPKNVVVTDEIRQAEYKYTYSDRSATSERFNYVDMVAQAMQMFVKSGLQANIQEIFIWYMEQKGVENPERFIQNLNLIDPQVQQVLLQNPQIAPVIQEMQRRVELAKQGQELPSNDMSEGSEFTFEQPQGEQSLPDKLNNLPGRHLLSE